MEKEFNLSSYMYQIFGVEVYQAEHVKEFIKEIEFWGEINLSTDTLTINYSKFIKLAGEELSK